METNFSLINDSEKANVFTKTYQGISKIETEKISGFLNLLREKLAANEEYKVSGIGLDTSTNEFKVNFPKSLVAERKGAISEAEKMIIKAENTAVKEFELEIKNALQENRSEDLQMAAANFAMSIQKASQEFINYIKKANTDYLKNIKSVDPGHYREIKKAGRENINFREHALNRSIYALAQTIQIHIDNIKAATNLKNTQVRETVFTKAYAAYYNNIDKIQKDYDKYVEKADSKFSSVLAYEKTEVVEAEIKADLQSKNEIQKDEQTINIAACKAKKEYDLEIRNALQFSDQEKRSKALQKAGNNFEISVQKAGKKFIRDIKQENKIYLENIQSMDPLHYPEIKKTVEENTRFRENAVISSNNASAQAIKIHIGYLKAAANLINPEEREPAIIKANTDLNNKLLTWQKILAELLKTLAVNILPL
jgi:hypothetical protein